jgi:short-subunit dehydrogenase
LKDLNTSAKTALVTGAASGLGYELALLLAADDFDLILVDIDKINLEKAKVMIGKASSSNIKLIEKDLSAPNAAKELFDEIQNTAIEVLINNAGFGVYGTFSNTDWEREYDMLNLHIITTTHLTKLVLKGMLERGSGRIMNMSSLAAFQPGPMMSLYYASKAYILSFSEAIANELIGTGVTVTALCPGQTNTSFQGVVSEGNCPENRISFNIGCADEVAKYGYRAMRKGKTVAVPGTFNKFLSKLPRFVSRKMATAVIRRIQDKNRGY